MGAVAPCPLRRRVRKYEWQPAALAVRGLQPGKALMMIEAPLILYAVLYLPMRLLWGDRTRQHPAND
jgi:hypothetical protein